MAQRKKSKRVEFKASKDLQKTGVASLFSPSFFATMDAMEADKAQARLSAIAIMTSYQKKRPKKR